MRQWFKNFADWNAMAVSAAFGLRAQDSLPTLESWVSSVVEDVSPNDASTLEKLRLRLKKLQYAWNEYEIMAGFIAPLLSMISFEEDNFGLFHHRKLTLAYEGLVAEGNVDGLVSFGSFEPERPFFFLHEYKKSQGYDADPEGQLLIAMVAAQRLNDDGLPLYGCYIVGRFWSFVLLDGKEYAVSQGYDATDPEELRIIWSVLQHTKRIVEERVEAILAAES